MKRCELQPIFTELRLFKDSAAALRGSPQPSQYLSDSKKISTNTETEMLSLPSWYLHVNPIQLIP